MWAHVRLLAVVLLICACAIASSAGASAAPVALKVTLIGRGTIVLSSGQRLTCGGPSCARTFRLRRGTNVLLSEFPASQWKFSLWRGACQGTAISCRVRIQSPQQISAVFLRAVITTPTTTKPTTTAPSPTVPVPFGQTYNWTSSIFYRIASASEGSDAASACASLLKSYTSYVYVNIAGSGELSMSSGQTAPDLAPGIMASWASVERAPGGGYCYASNQPFPPLSSMTIRLAPANLPAVSFALG
jgi:hypothetical protein